MSLSEVKAEVRRNSNSLLLPFSFPDRHSAKRDGGLLLPFPRGDRPPGNVPDGMSKIKVRSFPQNTANYSKTPSHVARASSAFEMGGAELPDRSNAVKRDVAVCCNDGEVFNQRGCYNHAIRRVLVVFRQFPGPKHGLIRKRQR